MPAPIKTFVVEPTVGARAPRRRSSSWTVRTVGILVVIGASCLTLQYDYFHHARAGTTFPTGARALDQEEPGVEPTNTIFQPIGNDLDDAAAAADGKDDTFSVQLGGDDDDNDDQAKQLESSAQEGPAHDPNNDFTTASQGSKDAYNAAWKKSLNATITCSLMDGTDRNNVSFPLTPHFIIIGAQKAGTSALGSLLNLHPRLKSARREAHFFDESKYLLQNLNNLDNDEIMCRIRKNYYNKWQHKSGDRGKLFFEKTPRYLIMPDVPELIEKVCPWKPKIIAILRNPIDRLQSHHKMNVERARGTAGLSLDEAIDAELDVLRNVGLSHAPPLGQISEGRELDQDGDQTLVAAFDIPGISLQEREDIVRKLYKDPRKSEHSLIQRGMYAVQLETWLEHYTLGESLHVINYERLRSEPAQVWKEIQDFLQVPVHDLDESIFGKDYSPNKGSYRESFPNATLVYLKRFYKPYNDRLADLLGEEWRGVWE